MLTMPMSTVVSTTPYTSSHTGDPPSDVRRHGRWSSAAAVLSPASRFDASERLVGATSRYRGIAKHPDEGLAESPRSLVVVWPSLKLPLSVSWQPAVMSPTLDYTGPRCSPPKGREGNH